MTREELINNLRQVSNGDLSCIKFINLGLCGNFLDYCTLEVQDECEDLFRYWTKYSNEYMYPVPAPEEYSNPVMSFEMSANLYEGEYGKLRMELAGFLADELEKTK